ncbi:hypothetical protein BJV78DRAFT_692975 [Lactifluus subvellereus]|nr:hypothetical protein BJV78DRAFT_692975 [Lactifluus subvellereus]
MVNFHDPSVVSQDAWAVMKLWHAVDGLFLWEFVTTLDYELSVVRGRRPYRWTIWIYSLTRIATLVAVILNMVGFDVTRSINCQLWVIFELIFAYLAFATASILIVLRIFAIWDRNKIVLALATGAWATNISFLIQGIVRLHSSWVSAQNTCVVLNTESSKPNIIVTLVTDIVLLLIMLAGLLRIRCYGGGKSSLWSLLLKHGLIWVLLATIAEVPPTVFIYLNLNDAFNLMFQTPSLITMSIAATRMYRSLAEFGSSNIAEGFQTSGFTASEIKRVPIAPIPLNRMQPSWLVH